MKLFRKPTRPRFTIVRTKMGLKYRELEKIYLGEKMLNDDMMNKILEKCKDPKFLGFESLLSGLNLLH